MRRPGQQDDNALASIELTAQPLSWRGPVRIWKHHRTLENVRLLGIVGGHFPATRGEPPLNASQNLLVATQWNPQSLGHRLAGKVIFGRPQTAAENYDLRAKERMLRGFNQAFAIVANNAFEDYFNTQLIDLLGEIERVRVHAEGCQQL